MTKKKAAKKTKAEPKSIEKEVIRSFAYFCESKKKVVQARKGSKIALCETVANEFKDCLK